MRVSSGTVHQPPADLKQALAASPKALAAWEDISPLARNEWICWTISVKQEATRKDQVTKGSCKKSGLGAQRGDAPTLLLDRLHSPQRQKDQQIHSMGARSTSQSKK